MSEDRGCEGNLLFKTLVNRNYLLWQLGSLHAQIHLVKCMPEKSLPTAQVVKKQPKDSLYYAAKRPPSEHTQITLRNKAVRQPGYSMAEFKKPLSGEKRSQPAPVVVTACPSALERFCQVILKRYAGSVPSLCSDSKLRQYRELLNRYVIQAENTAPL